MTKSQAYEIAHKRPQGGQWVVVTSRPGTREWYESAPMSYWAACAAVREAREEAMRSTSK